MSNLINLSSYIKLDCVKNKFTESCEIVTNIEEAESIARKISLGKTCNIIFETSSLKNRFFSTLKTQRQDICIINCDSGDERFINDINEAQGLIIFDNVNKCKDLNRFNYIKKNKILIC